MSVSLGLSATVINNATYNGFPGIAQFPNESLLCAYRAATDHSSLDGIIKYQVSTDGGTTWGAAATLYDPPTADHGAREPGVILLANGKFLATFTIVVGDPVTAVDVYVSVGTITGSTVSWGAPILACNDFTGGAASHAIGDGNLRQLQNGTILLSVYGLNTGDANQSAGVVASTDNGATWGNIVLVASNPASVAYSEMSLAQMSNGTVVALIRNDTLQGYTRSQSTDNGATWSAPVDVINLGGSQLAGKPALTLLPSGDLFLFTRGPGGGGTKRAVYTTSSDNGVTWAAFTNYGGDVPFEYASAQVLSNQAIGSVLSRENSSTDAFITYQEFLEAAAGFNAAMFLMGLTSGVAALAGFNSSFFGMGLKAPGAGGGAVPGASPGAKWLLIFGPKARGR